MCREMLVYNKQHICFLILISFHFECLTFHSLLFIFLSSHNEAEPSMVRSGAYSIGKFCQANKYVLIFKFMSNDLQTVAAPGGGRARGAIAPL